MRCPACAHENPDPARFCNECGGPLDQEPWNHAVLARVLYNAGDTVGARRELTPALAEMAKRRGRHDEAVGYLDRAAALFQQYGATLYLRRVLATKEILKA